MASQKRRRFLGRAALAAGAGLLGSVSGMAWWRWCWADDLRDQEQWLESLDSAEVRAWVARQNLRTAHAYADSAAFRRLQAQLLPGAAGALDDAPDLGDITEIGGYRYHLLIDAGHPRGLWRRSSAGASASAPQWETVLDLDALAAEDGIGWDWHGLLWLEPDCRRALLWLSDGGSDALAMREFDLERLRFVDDGFQLPLGQHSAAWIDQDEIYVATDFGPGSTALAGYPRTLRRWRRGTPLAMARWVFEAPADQLGIVVIDDSSPGYPRRWLAQIVRDGEQRAFLLDPATQVAPRRLDIPSDARLLWLGEFAILVLGSALAHADQRFPAGSMVSLRADELLAGRAQLRPRTVWAPGPGQALAEHIDRTRDYLLINVMTDAVSLPYALWWQEGGWQQRALAEPLGLVALSAAGKGSKNNHYVLQAHDFGQASKSFSGHLDADAGADADAGVARAALHAFAAAATTVVSQHFAVSQDGTRVPYFQIQDKTVDAHGRRPTLLSAYGGFGVSKEPAYLGQAALDWLARGGVYVVANLRGGGEYGPAWHRAAMRQHRFRAHDDLAAVARDLVARGVTSPARLGTYSASNGGLLVGNMLTRYPGLFGAIVCEAPLLDMRRYTRLSAGPVWIAEYGDPDEPADWRFLRAFSPYHQLRREVDYPPVLFLTAANDDLTHPAHARKMAERMQQMGWHQAYFHEAASGGHGGDGDAGQVAFRDALLYSFLWRHLAPGWPVEAG